MKTPRTFVFGVLCATVVAGTFVLAAPQFPIQQPAVPRVQVPEIPVPTIGVPRADFGPLPPVSREQQTMRLPVISPELVRAYLEAAERGLNYLPGRVLVKFRRGVGIPGQSRALSVMGNANPYNGLEWTGEVAIVKDTTRTDPHVLAARLRQQPEVEFAEPDYLMRPDATPNDPSFGTLQWNFTLINVPSAWDLSPGGSSDVIVAVVDTGVTAIPLQNVTVSTWSGSAIVNHTMPVGPSDDFSFSRFVTPRDFTLNASSPSTIVIDTEGHGTHVAGTIGEDTNNGVRLAGIAYNVRIMPLKACQSFWDIQFAMSAAGIAGRPPLLAGGCSTSATSAAIRFAADNGARVLNYSIGGTSPNTTVLTAMQYAISKGVFIAMSNGNSFESVNPPNPTTYPASYGPSLNGAMSVAATTRVETKAWYSTTGAQTEIAAPGGDTRQGNVIWQASIFPPDSDQLAGVLFPRFDRYASVGIQGTSMASPHVAGLAALLLSRMPNLTPGGVEQIIKASAKDIGTAGRDDSFGHGMIQPRNALFGRGIR